jgi:hypothetical protein
VKKRIDPARIKTFAPVVIVAPTLKQLAARKKPQRIDLARCLAGIKVFHELGRTLPEFQSTHTVPVPVEVLEMLGEYLAGTAAWAAEQNAVRAQKAAEDAKEWQVMANKIWRDNPLPLLSKLKVAKKIVRKLREQFGADRAPKIHAVRQRIQKPKIV